MPPIVLQYIRKVSKSLLSRGLMVASSGNCQTERGLVA